MARVTTEGPGVPPESGVPARYVLQGISEMSDEQLTEQVKALAGARQVRAKERKPRTPGTPSAAKTPSVRDLEDEGGM